MDNIIEIILRDARGEASGVERRTLDDWRARAPENEEWYRDILRVMELGGELRKKLRTERVSTRTVIEKATEPAREQRPARPEPEKTGTAAHTIGLGRRRWAVGFASAAAAAAVLVIGLTGLADRFAPDGGGPGAVDSAGPLEYRTDANSGRSIQLPRGILAHLGPSTRLEMQESGAGQDTRIWLEGRAFFGVEGRPDRRVVVETPGGTISVIGTRFEAYASDEELQLLVVDGTVGVSAGGDEEIQVTSGERSVVTQGVIAAPIRVEDPLVHLDWMGHGMVFQSTPLDQVAAEIAFRYGASVTLGDPALRERTLTTAFDGHRLEEVVAIVCRAVRLTCEVDGDVVVLGAE